MNDNSDQLSVFSFQLVNADQRWFQNPASHSYLKIITDHRKLRKL